MGFVTQHFPQPKACNGTSADGGAELESTLGRRNREHRRENFDENYKNWNEGTLSGHSSESGVEEEMHGESRLLEDSDFQFGKEVSPSKPRKGDGNKCCLFVAEIRYFIELLRCWKNGRTALSVVSNTAFGRCLYICICLHISRRVANKRSRRNTYLLLYACELW